MLRNLIGPLFPVEKPVQLDPLMSTDIPFIDLSLWTDGTPESRQSLARQFDSAARNVGFLQLLNHSIAPDTLSKVLSAADAFYALPTSAKALVSPPSKAVNRGYAAPRSESLALSLSSSGGDDAPPKPDTFEAFNVGEDDVDEAHPFYAKERHRFFAPNIWPQRPEGFQEAVVAYFRAAKKVALTVVDVMAVALEMGEGYFDSIVDRSTTTMRVINYSPENDDPFAEHGSSEDGAKRMGAHR